MVKAVFPGTFDPITKGHSSVVRRISGMYDQVTVLVAKNPGKKALFSAEERRGLIETIAKDCRNVKVDVIEDRYVPMYALQNDAKVIIRSTRNVIDYAYEDIIKEAYRQIGKGVEIIYVPPAKELEHVSSSLVKDLVGYDGWETQVKEYLDAAVFSKFLEKNLDRLYVKKVWDGLMGRLGADAETAKKEFAVLMGKYAESHRAYHTIYHITEIFREIERNRLDIPDTLSLSLFFHDAVYDPSRKDNEAESAAYVGESLSRLGLSLFGSDVGKLVLATDYATVKAFSGITAVQKDLDFSIFAADTQRFFEYDGEIRSEYSMYSDADFRKGRSAFLVGMLEKGVFSTETYLKMEARAERNISMLLVDKYFDLIDAKMSMKAE